VPQTLVITGPAAIGPMITRKHTLALERFEVDADGSSQVSVSAQNIFRRRPGSGTRTRLNYAGSIGTQGPFLVCWEVIW